MATLLDLADRMKQVKASLSEQASLCARQGALAIVSNLANSTPVDTSAALSNWQVSLENPNYNWIAPHVLGHKGSTQLASIRATIEEAKYNLENKKPGQIIYISNNAEYIIELNNGSSKQAPAGFVERAILVGKQTVKNFQVKII